MAKDEFSVTRVLDGDVVTEKILVSTVFLGLDHSFGDGPPVLWETMVFNGEHDQDQWRYTSQEEAIAGHSHAVQVAKGEVKDDRE